MIIISCVRVHKRMYMSSSSQKKSNSLKLKNIFAILATTVSSEQAFCTAGPRKLCTCVLPENVDMLLVFLAQNLPLTFISFNWQSKRASFR